MLFDKDDKGNDLGYFRTVDKAVKENKLTLEQLKELRSLLVQAWETDASGKEHPIWHETVYVCPFLEFYLQILDPKIKELEEKEAKRKQEEQKNQPRQEPKPNPPTERNPNQKKPTSKEEEKQPCPKCGEMVNTLCSTFKMCDDCLASYDKWTIEELEFGVSHFQRINQPNSPMLRQIQAELKKRRQPSNQKPKPNPPAEENKPNPPVNRKPVNNLQSHPDNEKKWGRDFGQLKPAQREGRIATDNSWKKSCEKEGSRRDLICPYCQAKFTFNKTITDFLPAQKEVESRLNTHKNNCSLKNNKTEQKNKAQAEWDKIRASKGKITRSYTCKKCWGRILQDANIVDVELAKKQNWADLKQHEKECHKSKEERMIAVYHSPNQGGNEHANINDFTYEDMNNEPLEESNQEKAYQEQNPNKSKGLSRGVIALVISGGVILAGIIGLVVWLVMRNKNKSKEN